MPWRALLVAVALAGTGAATAPAFAADSKATTIEAKDFDRMVRVFAENGYAFNIQKLDDGERYFEGETETGVKYSVYFYGGADGEKALSIQFFAYWDPDNKITLAELNDWNTRKRWVRAYRDPDENVCIAMDVTLLYGVTEENLADWAGVFEMMADDFQTFYDESAGS